MHISTFLTGLLATGATLLNTVDAGCYNGGRSMTAILLKYHAQRACEGYDGKQGDFQGYFPANSFRRTCVNLEGGRVLMEVGNLNTRDGFDIKDSDCTKELQAVVNKCPQLGLSSQGGRFDSSGWTFRVDPNDGKCKSGDFINTP
ncbi:hypothetical protein FLONG3_696 [Fusarium longipes]|uniref:Secreted protein n=1 Tax=Fusarium longipes TaxID=694270 RepID=A0A395T9P9_9HYPO|nr:hypothetical protein FLONG3_696 [Fusarium longipes]